jgi:hypothetical protein
MKQLYPKFARYATLVTVPRDRRHLAMTLMISSYALGSSGTLTPTKV